eukprot:3641156-Alexandrium_andersonii.AAC.1
MATVPPAPGGRKPPITETPPGRVENSASHSARPWIRVLERTMPNWGRRQTQRTARRLNATC